LERISIVKVEHGEPRALLEFEVSQGIEHRIPFVVGHLEDPVVTHLHEAGLTATMGCNEAGYLRGDQAGYVMESSAGACMHVGDGKFRCDWRPSA